MVALAATSRVGALIGALAAWVSPSTKSYSQIPPASATTTSTAAMTNVTVLLIYIPPNDVSSN
jgi:hypothetical protein